MEGKKCGIELKKKERGLDLKGGSGGVKGKKVELELGKNGEVGVRGREKSLRTHVSFHLSTQSDRLLRH